MPNVVELRPGVILGSEPEIDGATIQNAAWRALNPLARITAEMRKADLDRFHYGLMQLAQGMVHLQAGLSALARDDKARAFELSGMSAGEIASAMRLFSMWYDGVTTFSVPRDRRPRKKTRTRKPKDPAKPTP